MKKKIFAFITAAVLGTQLLTGCGSSGKNKDDDKVITLSVCNIKAYEDTTKVWADEVAKLGYTLDYQIVSSGPQLNQAVEDGDCFATYHQHTPAMNDWNERNKGHLAVAFKVFTDRAGIFSTKYKSLDELPDGAKIVIANDAGNSFRGLVMLADAGLIKIRDDIDPVKVTQKDIIENPKNFEFIEVDYAMLSKTIEDADAGFLYATIATELGLFFEKDALIGEREELQEADIIAVREEDVGSEKAKVLEKAYKTDAMKQALKDTFGGENVLEPAW